MVVRKISSFGVLHCGGSMIDESQLPVAQQSLVFRLRKRAEIRRQIPGRLAVTEGKPDKIANLLDEAAEEIEKLMQKLVDNQ